MTSGNCGRHYIRNKISRMIFEYQNDLRYCRDTGKGYAEWKNNFEAIDYKDRRLGEKGGMVSSRWERNAGEERLGGVF